MIGDKTHYLCKYVYVHSIRCMEHMVKQLKNTPKVVLEWMLL